MTVVYYSSPSNYTHRFVAKLETEALRLPILTREDTPVMDRPFVLVTPTYGAGPNRGAVPKQVIKFLNVERNRELLHGVIGAGNTNFGETYCQAAAIIAVKCQVPLMYRFELLGTDRDVARVDQGLKELWTRTLSNAM